MNLIKRVALTVLSLGVVAAWGSASDALGMASQDRIDYAGGVEPAAAQVQPSMLRLPRTHYDAARAALIAGNTDEAALEVKLALQDNPLDASSHFLLGCLLEQKGEHDQAIVAFQHAAALDPTNADALYNLGTMLLLREEVLPASRLLENAVLIRPDHVPYYNNLAKAYFLAGLPELAVATYEEALRRDSSNAVALGNLLLLAQAAGMDDAASAYQQRLEALESSDAAEPADGAGEPVAPLPTWPIVTAAADPPQQTQPPATRAPEPQAEPDKEADDLRELLRDLPHVTVERRAGRLTLIGWTSGPAERAMLDRIVAESVEVLDLTSDDIVDSQRMIELDAVIFTVTVTNQEAVGFNFLNLIDVNFNYFASDSKGEGTGYVSPPDVAGSVDGLSQQSWIFAAAASYSVNIANAADSHVTVLAQPHLTTLNGSSASFLAGGELIFEVSGINSGDIKPYPFGTSLTVTPTLLLTPAEDGTPRVRLKVEAGRTSGVSVLDADPDAPINFQKVTVASEAVLNLGQTLILSGLTQREIRKEHSGVPGLMHVPILKHFFSTTSTIQSDAAVVILLTPRDAAFSDARNRKAMAEFVQMRREFLKARQGTAEDMRLFRERYPKWGDLPPNRFASHIFLMENSRIYRFVAGQDLSSEEIDLEVLGPGAEAE